MAQKQVPEEPLPANRPSDVTSPVNETNDLIRQAPEPASGKGKVYQVVYPNSQFVMEGMPVVNSEGVRLTSEQADKVLEAARVSGVRIVEVED